MTAPLHERAAQLVAHYDRRYDFHTLPWPREHWADQAVEILREVAGSGLVRIEPDVAVEEER